MRPRILIMALALLLPACLPPASERVLQASQIAGRVMPVGQWDMGCDNLGHCTAIGALPPRKAQMEGQRAALRIAFGAPGGLEANLTVIPLDFEQRLPDEKPGPADAARIARKLREGGEPIIWHTDGMATRFYLPGEGFGRLEALHGEWLRANEHRWVESEAIMPTKGEVLYNFRSPLLTAGQLAECDAPDKGTIRGAWDIGSNLRLYEYACSPPGRFHAESLWYTLDKQAAQFMPIGIEEAVGPQTGGKAAGLYNARFNAAQGLLVTSKFAGTRDCGLTATYAATPSGFVLAERREARHCVGLFPGDWVRTYRSPAVILPEHW